MAKKTPSVEEFLNQLDHPLKPVVEAVRQAILRADVTITEGVKWNAPSFCVVEYFATADYRGGKFVRVVFHRGAKVKDGASEMTIDDPEEVLEWHAKDRCSAKFHDVNEVKSKAKAFRAIVRQWIRQM